MLWKALPTTIPYTHFYFPLFLSCQQPWPQKPISLRHLNTEDACGCETRPVCYWSACNIPFCRALESLHAAEWCCRWKQQGRGWAQARHFQLYSARSRNTLFAGIILWFVKSLFHICFPTSFWYSHWSRSQTIITTKDCVLPHTCITSISKINALFPWCFCRARNMHRNRPPASPSLVSESGWGRSEWKNNYKS